MCEGLIYGYKAGLNLDETIAAVGAGAAGSWSINNLGPRMVVRNFNPGFFVEHFIKDMGIALDEAKRMNLSLPGLAMAHQLYMAVKAQGNGKLGTQALLLALEQMSGLTEGISVQKKDFVRKSIFLFKTMASTALRRIHAVFCSPCAITCIGYSRTKSREKSNDSCCSSSRTAFLGVIYSIG